MIGQMVLIKEDFLPINTWPLGRIMGQMENWYTIGRIHSGELPSEIARALNVNRSEISRFWNLYQNKQCNEHLVVDVFGLQLLAMTVICVCKLDVIERVQLFSRVAESSGIMIFRLTVCKRLHQSSVFQMTISLGGIDVVSKNSSITMGSESHQLKNTATGQCIVH
ncbi:hypothetical protein TNCV_4736401 [Trichonephila clavipes]|nr:hypothetical protein TNCV_4736401 [Trichonephila clavipes]